MPQPTNTVQFFQIWQGSPMSPPLEMRLLPGGNTDTFYFDIWVRNNITKANPSAGIRVFQGFIIRGIWNVFEMMIKMQNTSDSQDGELNFWLNGNKLVAWSGRSGYAIGIEYGGISYTPNMNFDSFFGPYRPCQSVNLKMYFDQIKYASTYEDAAP